MASHGRGMAIDDPAVGIELNSCTGLWQCRGVESADTTANQNQPAKSDDAVNAADTFPRQYARTRRFSLGEPRGFQVAPDGRNIAFLRSGSSNDPVNRLYVLERSGQGGWIERCVFDPAAESSTAGDQPLTPEERARRERMRETSSGITSYDVDRDCTKAVFALGGSLHTVSLATAEPLCTLTTPAGPFDPRLSPDGTLVAFVAGGALHIAAANGTPLHGSASWVTVAADDNKDVTWGIADFNAAEEFDHRIRKQSWPHGLITRRYKHGGLLIPPTLPPRRFLIDIPLPEPRTPSLPLRCCQLPKCSPEEQAWPKLNRLRLNQRN
jgi:hypothetical protein